MKSYVIRVYREESTESDNIIGVLQSADEGWEQTFTSPQQLWSILERTLKGTGRFHISQNEKQE